jgi:hypothetical protein
VTTLFCFFLGLGVGFVLGYWVGLFAMNRVQLSVYRGDREFAHRENQGDDEVLCHGWMIFWSSMIIAGQSAS